MITKELNYALAEIAGRRQRAENAVDNLRKGLLADPYFLELENEKGGLEFQIARLTAYGMTPSETQTKRLKALCEEEKAYLSEKGLTLDDFIPKYTCPYCRDTGFVGKEKCACLKNVLYAVLRKNSGRRVTDVSEFSEINTEIYRENKQAYASMIKQLEKYCQTFPDTKEILVFSGGVGVGKTFLTGVIANRLMKNNFSVLFISACELNQLFLRFHSAFAEDKTAIFEPLTECDLLIIDDLGSEPVYKNVTTNYLYYLLTVRQGKNTIITTNLSPLNPKTGANELMIRYEQRVFSRLADKQGSAIISIVGRDLRMG